MSRRSRCASTSRPAEVLAGTAWVNSAWLVWRGLVRLGYEEQAAHARPGDHRNGVARRPAGVLRPARRARHGRRELRLVCAGARARRSEQRVRRRTRWADRATTTKRRWIPVSGHWQPLDYTEWQETCDTLHAHTQVARQARRRARTARAAAAARRVAAHRTRLETAAAPGSRSARGALVAGLDLRSHEAFVEHNEDASGAHPLAPDRPSPKSPARCSLAP